MANRMKEDEKNEKIIRGLLKLPPNRRCINCNSLGPQYVCTNFWTFICTNCSGLHREFTHRVKSISMAKFTSQEVSALQEGGNARAREIYFKEWDPERHSFPDSSNIDRLREFIRHAYVDRRFTGERSVDRPPRGKVGDREDYNENRREDSIRGGSRSPPYGDTYERRYSERPGSGGSNDERKIRFGYEGRSPGYDQGDYKRSPGLDERRRDDKPGNGNQNQRFEDRRFPDGVSRPEGRSPNHQKDIDASSPPVVRPVRDILGSDVPPLRVGEPPKANGTKSLDNSAQVQSNSSSSSRGSSVGNAVELKKANFESLIDFDTDPQPPVAIAPIQSIPQRTASLPATSGDWASFDFPPQHNTPSVASNVGQLESELSQLSAPGFTPAVSNSPLLVAGGDLFPKSNNGGQWPTMLQHQVMPTSTPFRAPAVAALNNQSWGSPVAPSLQVSFTVPTVQSSQASMRPPHETNTGALPQPSVEVKPVGRKELPEDIFTAMYPAGPTSGLRTGAPLGMGYGMQYPTSELRKMPTFPQPNASRNPFDVGNESSLRHSPTFPTMTSLQGALPNMNDPSVLLQNSSYIAHTQGVPPQLPSYTYPTSSSPYMVQQYPMNMPQQAPSFIPLGHPGFGGGGPVFSSSTINQHSAAGNSQMGPPNSFVPSVGGNPFG